MKRWMVMIGIGLSMLLLLSVGRVSAGAAAKPTATPTPTPSPTPMVYQQIATSREATHPDRWTDVFGNEILLDGRTDCGNIVVSFTVGQGREPESSSQEIGQALGWPDYDPETGSGVLNLGRGGELIIDMNAYIHDSAGMFLYIFTTGQPEDKMTVSLSADLNKWYEIEVKSKDFTALDKYTNIPAKTNPRYVKIKDRSETGSGICIDAVVAFDAEPIVKVVNGSGGKKAWYERFGLSKRNATVLCVGVGSFLVIAVALVLIRKINIRRRRKNRRLRLVYSRDHDRDDENGE
ncbi:MAG: hypothetical protein J5649_02625 [Lachnospiraceae bacterium]|nr:hypothetical protein [Lachnospiraceae bacterium]